MKFNYEKLGIQVNFSDEEKEKIVAIKNDPHREVRSCRAVTADITALPPSQQRYGEETIRWKYYQRLVRDIWEADNWKIDRYGPAHEHKLYLTRPLRGKDIQ